MTTYALLGASLFVQVCACVAVLAFMIRRKSQSIFPQLVWMLAAQGAAIVISLGTLYYRKTFHLSRDQAYFVYYYSSWFLTVAILILRILAVYGVFAEAMRPLSGLHQAGKIIFRWVGVVSGLVALAMVAGPGMFSTREGISIVISHLQQGVCVLTLCLLVFVCFAVRPLGLTFRSHLFGVALGLGVASTVELVQAAWLVTYGARSVYSPIYLFSSLGMCVSLLVWGFYFGMPEPARRMILLPTTSPFFFWNRISEILGDSPGHVAVAGISPDMLAPAEIDMLTTATAGDAEFRTNHEEPASTEARPEVFISPGFAAVPRPSLA